MSGFERANGGAWTTDEHASYPDDFSSEEAEFASELRSLFDAERENLPPLYADTLLSDVRHAAADPCFEQKLAYHVLHRLALPRGPLFARRGLRLPELRDMRRQMTRPIAAVVSGIVLLMVLTMVVATPSFASGLSLLLGHTGVHQVSSYPSNVRPSTHPSGTSKSAPLALNPDMAVGWLGHQAGSYSYAGTRLLQPTDWSRGPILEMQYVLPGQSAGTGLLDIREFQVSSTYAAVLQVVQIGSASLVKVGDTSAVYVDGAWMPRSGHSMWPADDSAMPYVWQTGVRSELIFERAGVVYWVVADQRDGAGQDELIHLASQLAPADPHLLRPQRISVLDAEASLDASFRVPVGNEVYQLVQSGLSVDSGVGAFVAPPSS